MSGGVLIEKADALELLEMLSEYRARKRDKTARSTAAINNQRQIYVRNDDTEAAPPYACMQVVDTIEVAGQNYLIVKKPVDSDGSAGWFVFNGPSEIEEDGGFGIAFDGPMCRMLTDGSTVAAGDVFGPVDGEWWIEPGGSLFCIAGEDDIADDVVKGFFMGGGGNHYLYTLTSSSVGTIRDIGDTTEIETGATVVNTLSMFADQTTGDRGICVKQGGVYYRIQAPCNT